MQNNANQSVHTNYAVNDVFKPNAANRLAESIHYDFVVTQRQWDNYIDKHPGDTDIDLGAVIASTEDGYDSSSATIVPVKAPVSIYIEADTGNTEHPLILNGLLISKVPVSTGKVVDISDFTDNGVMKLPQTNDAINIYASHPYAVKNIVGGINHWSTPKAPVKFMGIHVENGVTRAGAYATYNVDPLHDPSDPLEYGNITGCIIICQLLVSNGGTVSGGFTISPTGTVTTNTYYPPVIYADWMSGTTAGCMYYHITTDDTQRKGLFQQIRISQALGTDPILYEQDVDSGYTYRYISTRHSASDVIFSNAETGVSLRVSEDGTITRVHASVGKTVIVSDYDVKDIPLLFDVDVTHQYEAVAVSMKRVFDSAYDWARITVNRGNGFMTVDEDCPDYIQSALKWYSASLGGVDSCFKFKGATVLELYRWHAVYSVESGDTYPSSTHHMTAGQWYTNTEDSRDSLSIDADDLKEGVIYTVRVHTMLLPLPVKTTYVDTSIKLFEQASTKSVLEELYMFKLLFVTQEGWLQPAYWGSTTTDTGESRVNLYINVLQNIEDAPQSGLPPESVSIPPRNTLRQIMFGEVMFVKLNGTIYIMRY